MMLVVVVNCSESSTGEEAVLRQGEKAGDEICHRG